MKNLLLIAILVVLAAVAKPVFGQADVLAAGDPLLTEADFAAVVRFYERGLKIRFSEAERAELREKFVETWRRAQKTNAADLTEFMKTVGKINTIDAEKIRANQQDFRDALIGDLRKMSANGWASFVLDIYENAAKQENPARNANAETDSDENTNAEASNEKEPDFQPVTVRGGDLTGKWVKSTTASYGYRNTVTNDYRGGYGAANQHDIYAGGNFDYTNYAQVSGYGCTTELYTSMKGRYSVSGAQITFSYVSGTVKIEDSCKKSTVTKPAQIKASTYRLERAGDQLRMCEVGAENPTCLYKARD